MGTVVIRQACPEDIRLLWQWASDQDADAFQIWGADFVYDYPPDLQQFLDSFHSRKDVIFLTFLQDGEAVGLCELTEPKGQEHTISRLILSPCRRGRGLGSRCLDAVSRWASERLGDRSLRLVVYEHNTAARKCYEKSGFSYGSRLQRPGRLPAWEMRRLLHAEDR